MTDTITLNMCMYWECPKCEHINYEHGTTAQLTDEDRLVMGITEDMGVMMQSPSTVVCAGCKAEYDILEEAP